VDDPPTPRPRSTSIPLMFITNTSIETDTPLVPITDFLTPTLISPPIPSPSPNTIESSTNNENSVLNNEEQILNDNDLVAKRRLSLQNNSISITTLIKSPLKQKNNILNKMNITYDSSKLQTNNTLFSVLTSPSNADKNTHNNGFNNQNEFLDSNIFDISNNSNVASSPKNIIKNKIQSTSMNTSINKENNDVYIKDLANSIEKSNQIFNKMNNDNINTLKSIGSTGAKERGHGSSGSLSKMIGGYEYYMYTYI
jgi:hypothetical protein